MQHEENYTFNDMIDLTLDLLLDMLCRYVAIHILSIKLISPFLS